MFMQEQWSSRQCFDSCIMQATLQRVSNGPQCLIETFNPKLTCSSQVFALLLLTPSASSAFPVPHWVKIGIQMVARSALFPQLHRYATVSKMQSPLVTLKDGRCDHLFHADRAWNRLERSRLRSHLLPGVEI
jgi:hypothetical protein